MLSSTNLNELLSASRNTFYKLTKNIALIPGC